MSRNVLHSNSVVPRLAARQVRLTLVAACAAVAACVPTGNAPPYDAGPAPAAPTFKPSLNVMTAPFEDDFDRADGGELVLPPPGADARAFAVEAGAGRVSRDAAAATDASALLSVDAAISATATTPNAVADGGAEGAIAPPSNLGPNWTATRMNGWRVENGRLCAENAHNHGIWLNRTLPVNARIEFDAIALSDVGDLKAEVWGDGHSYATGTSYTMATSYLAILGGWKNTTHVLARLNEHGTDRKEIVVDRSADDPRQQPIVKGQVYQFKIERTDAKTVRVIVNGVEYFSWADAAPLAGQGHDHLGFNEWEAKVCFDNVKVTPLGS